MNADPVFLVAARRSGTTLLRLMLTSHPQLHWERGWEFATSLIGEDGKPPSFGKLQDLTIKLGIESVAIDESDDLMNAYRNILTSYIDKQCRSVSKNLFGATIHINYHAIHHVFPNSKFIHLVRDPRDVAFSAIKLGWDSTYWSAGKRWRCAEEEWETLKLNVHPNSRTEIRFEDLVSNPEEELTKLCEFIDVPYSSQLFDYIKNSKYGYPDPSLAERWRGKISSHDAALVESRAGELLDRRGYERTSPNFKPHIIERGRLRIYNGVANRSRRIKRDGIVFFLLEPFSQWFHVLPLKKYVHQKKQARHNKTVRNLEKNYKNK
jgi:Sulfotransferase family